MEELKEIETKAIRYCLLTMFVNSPTFSVLVIIGAITAEAVGWINKSWDTWLQAKTRLFAEEAVFRHGAAA